MAAEDWRHSEARQQHALPPAVEGTWMYKDVVERWERKRSKTAS